MAQTLISLIVHVIFSTKNREPFITPEIEPELFAYFGGILKNHESRWLDGGGTADHVHLLVSQSKHFSEFVDEGRKERQFLMAQDKRKRVPEFSLAGWIWRILNQSSGRWRFKEIHCWPERTSSKAHIPGRVDCVS